MDTGKNNTFVGIISTDHEFEEYQILHELERRGIQNIFIDPMRVTFQIENQHLKIYYDNHILNFLDIALVRQTRFGKVPALHLVRALNNTNIRTIEPYDVIALGISKFKAILDRLAMGFPVPDTIVSADYDSSVPFLVEDDFPMIYKPIMGWKGIGVEEITNFDEAKERLSHLEQNDNYPLLLQEKLDIKDEYRVLVVGFQALGTTKKVAPEGSITRNVAQGATLTRVKDRPDLESLAVKIAGKTKREIAGVDIIETVDGKLYILECNRNPGFQGFMEACPDINVPKIIVDYTLKCINH